ncbi:protein SLX4IP [Paramormyrops kingsleyae]|uniref:protein SLX4IP n=1 Tax=Paramormyrops kingsleyae TaxID=1676925 RepID=UPI003B9744F0
MSVSKFVVKCGNYAVLVDVQLLAPGAVRDPSWWADRHKEEVSALIQGAVEQRILGARHHKGPPKARRELTPANPLSIEGERLRLAVYSAKRHVNLRCIISQRYGDLRVFPERFVVCASVREDQEPELGADGNLSGMAAHGQSRSEYFHGAHETENPSDSAAITKRNALQKIVKQAFARIQGHRDPGGEPPPMLPPPAAAMTTGSEGCVPPALAGDGRLGVQAPGWEDNRVHGTPRLPSMERGEAGSPRTVSPPTAALGLAGIPSRCDSAPPQAGHGPEKRERGGHSSRRDGDGAKRMCLGWASDSPSEAKNETRFPESLAPVSMATRPQEPGLYQAAGSADSAAEPVLLTSGESDSGVLLAEVDAGLTGRDCPVADAKGPSGRAGPPPCPPVSSGPAETEREENVPRKSRLRRLKRA